MTWLRRTTRPLGPPESRLAVAALLAVLTSAAAVTGCTPSIGSACTLSTDCSVRGDRLCDTSQPNGYCTVLNCTRNTCPDDAVCVLFGSSVPGCGYDDYSSPSRTSQTFCVASCGGDFDCRTGDGYVCMSPPSGTALILDDNANQRICMIPPPPGQDGGTNDQTAAVCQASGPAVPPIDDAVGAVDGGVDTDADADAALAPDADAGAADGSAGD